MTFCHLKAALIWHPKYNYSLKNFVLCSCSVGESLCWNYSGCRAVHVVRGPVPPVLDRGTRCASLVYSWKGRKKKEGGKGGAGVPAIHFEGQKLYLKLETTKPHLTVLLKTIGWQSEVTAFDVTYLTSLFGVQNMFYLLHLYMLGVWWSGIGELSQFSPKQWQDWED